MMSSPGCEYAEVGRESNPIDARTDKMGRCNESSLNVLTTTTTFSPTPPAFRNLRRWLQKEPLPLLHDIRCGWRTTFKNSYPNLMESHGQSVFVDLVSKDPAWWHVLD